MDSMLQATVSVSLACKWMPYQCQTLSCAGHVKHRHKCWQVRQKGLRSALSLVPFCPHDRSRRPCCWRSNVQPGHDAPATTQAARNRLPGRRGCSSSQPQGDSSSSTGGSAGSVAAPQATGLRGDRALHHSHWHHRGTCVLPAGGTNSSSSWQQWQGPGGWQQRQQGRPVAAADRRAVGHPGRATAAGEP